MRNLLFICIILFFTECKSQDNKIKWLSFEEAIAKNKVEKKKIFIDLYTDWCGWCKKMDASTFLEPKLVKYMNKNYHCIKFNTEKEGPIKIADTTYTMNPSRGRNGTHDLAFELLQGKLSYPTFVILDENFNMLSPVPGYRTAIELEPVLKYFGDKAYPSLTWQEYQTKFVSTF